MFSSPRFTNRYIWTPLSNAKGPSSFISPQFALTSPNAIVCHCLSNLQQSTSVTTVCIPYKCHRIFVVVAIFIFHRHADIPRTMSCPRAFDAGANCTQYNILINAVRRAAQRPIYIYKLIRTLMVAAAASAIHWAGWLIESIVPFQTSEHDT